MPRRRRGRAQTAQARGQATRSRPRRRPQVDIDALTREVLESVYERLGLEGIIQPGDLEDIVRDVVESIVEARSTKPSAESIIKRIMASSQGFLKAVAARLIERPDDLTLEQLEFIVANAPDLAGRAAPVLYEAARRLGADHIIDALRSLWMQYGKPTPIPCPRCGFNAVAPDLTCIVCGASLDERKVKEAIGFREALKRFALTADPDLVREASEAGFVLVDHEIHPPSMRSLLGFYVELALTREEREEVRRILEERARSSRSQRA